MSSKSTTPFRVRVPGSTSNLGPGFDALSVALSLYLEVDIEPVSSGCSEWVGDWPSGDRNIYREALDRTAKSLGLTLPDLRFRARNEIPLQRGLGSSAAAITGGVLTACHLAGQGLGTREFLEIGLPLEGHPDNLAASWQGGWVLSWQKGEETRLESLAIRAPLLFVMAIPEIQISTARARQVLPTEYSRADLVFSVQRTALLLHSLYRDDRSLLRAALQDRIHQPYRLPLIPGAAEILSLRGLPIALQEAHLGSYLSGSGSTICSLTADPDAAAEIGKWMVGCFTDLEISAQFRILQADPKGGTVGEIEN